MDFLFFIFNSCLFMFLNLTHENPMCHIIIIIIIILN